jgi:PBSX family phage portal protein
MKPIVKSLPLTTPMAIKKSRDDYISNVIPSDFSQASDVLEPPYSVEALKNLRYSSIYHRKCLKAVSVDVTMSGWTLDSTNTEEDPNPESVDKNRLDTLFNDYSFETEWQKAIEDYQTYKYGVVEILQTSNGEVVGFKHLRATTCRITKDGDRVKQTVGSNSIYFKVAGTRPDEVLNSKTGVWYKDINPDRATPESMVLEGDDRATTVLWIGDTSPDSDYYGEPEYLSALLTILSDEYLREFNNNRFITNGVPNYLITVTGNFEEGEDEETGLTFSEALEEQILDLQNKPGTAIVFTIPTTDPENRINIEVTKISDESEEASFEQFRSSNRDEILAAHEVPPSRIGISINGPLAGSVDVERNRQYQEKTIRPLQRKVEQLINTQVVEDLMGIKSYRLRYRGLDTRDVKGELEVALELIRNGAMKPAELREQFGDIFNLVMDIDDTMIIDYNPELDEFYMNGQPLTLLEQAPLDEELSAVAKSIEGRVTEALRLIQS